MSRTEPSIDDIEAAFEQAFAIEPALKTAAKPEVRRKAEKKHALKHDDGRRKKATGRTAQFNLKIKPEYKARMVEAARQHDVLLAELAERAFDLVLAELAAKQQLATTKGKK